jgi:putative transposase
MLEPCSLELSLKAQAELLGLSRSSLYYCPMPPSPEEVAIKHRIDEIYTRWPIWQEPTIFPIVLKAKLLYWS